MNKDRAAQIRQRQQQNKLLQQQTKRMQQQLQKIRKIKQMQNEKIKLEMEMKSLNIKQQKKKAEIKQRTNLRGYGTKISKKNSQTVQKKMKQWSKKMLQSSSSDSNDDDNDGQNVRYFLQVMGLDKYFPILKQNKIVTLEKLKAVKQTDLKKLQIPLKDMVTINKKLRKMGIN